MAGTISVEKGEVMKAPDAAEARELREKRLEAFTEPRVMIQQFGIPINKLTDSDSYKVGHWVLYPPDTKTIYSYFESRGGAFNYNLFFGLQTFLKTIEGQWVTKEMIDDMERIAELHFQRKGVFNRKGWERILNVYGGKLPVTIKAVPEGTVLEPHNVLITIENNDPELFWLTNYLETALVRMWSPTATGTVSMGIKGVIWKYLNETGSTDGLDFKLHDFGSRGVSSEESAGIAGAAHLVNFKGTDTLSAIQVHRRVYGEEMAGFSVIATEHSIMTAEGRDGEPKVVKRLLDAFPTGIVACVADSYDLYNFVEHIIGEQFHDQIMARDGIFVVRPDSGIPHEVVLWTVEMLGKKVGYTVNEKGYKVLDPHVRVIQGDGINHESIVKILQVLKEHRWSAENVTFGMGGALLQKPHRDTLEMAFKCSWRLTTDGREVEVYKQPKTDSMKNSKRGRLKLIRTEDGKHKTVHPNDPGEDQLVEVFRDGEIVRYYTLAEIRRRADERFYDLMRRGETIKKVGVE